MFFGGTFRNNWRFNINPMAVTFGRVSVNALRGGPSLRRNTWHNSFFLGTDRRKPISFGAAGNVGGVFGTPRQFFGLSLSSSIRPSETVSISIDVRYN